MFQFLCRCISIIISCEDHVFAAICPKRLVYNPLICYVSYFKCQISLVPTVMGIDTKWQYILFN